jgi:hypothetical protein
MTKEALEQLYDTTGLSHAAYKAAPREWRAQIISAYYSEDWETMHTLRAKIVAYNEAVWPLATEIAPTTRKTRRIHVASRRREMREAELDEEISDVLAAKDKGNFAIEIAHTLRMIPAIVAMRDYNPAYERAMRDSRRVYNEMDAAYRDHERFTLLETEAERTEVDRQVRRAYQGRREELRAQAPKPKQVRREVAKHQFNERVADLEIRVTGQDDLL